MSRKFLWLTIFALGGLILFIVGSNLLADDAGNPFSGQSNSNAQTWYDETWEASGFYNLQMAGGANHNYTYVGDPTSVASTPSNIADLVVTEWDVTGHVHFSSGL